MTSIVQIRGEELHLLPERALYWPSEEMVMIADMHCGKAATFRAHSLPIPDGNMEADFGRLSSVLERTGAATLAILGDWIHAEAGCTAAVIRAVNAWRSRHPRLRVLWIRGNHDRVPATVVARFGLEDVGEALVSGPFLLQHKPSEHPSLFSIAGHIHPVVPLRGPGIRQNLACFYFDSSGALLPAFSSFTRGFKIHIRNSSRVFIPTGDEVVEWRSREA